MAGNSKNDIRFLLPKRTFFSIGEESLLTEFLFPCVQVYTIDIQKNIDLKKE
jgi:hypothetical protein